MTDSDMTHSEERDAVDDIVDQWARERPELDLRPMALVGRYNRFHAYVESALREYFAKAGLDFSEFDVLATLRRSGAPYELKPVELLKSAMVTSGAITNRVDKLSAKGLVERRPCETDRRAVLIRLTDAGKELIDNIVAGHVENEARLVDVLTRDEQEQLNGLLRKLLIAREPAAR
ncbi:MarR family winged helix-turn-helix transcriptional regulator [Yinghuangia seranimata]|uniref:MarR family winged helix-turn-helix transcriptional regulator n=1 Tax=Yinghuangia seranimata TaxID=408067 RepID=UPI00248B1FC3|nr:MarR family transcriptional regulator [Yinghuangia seranimata]MDI2126853.1 MarR family transcriptional regulator [Yinghuangia seranimata]